VTKVPEKLLPEDYVGPLTGMDFAKCPTADSPTNVHNLEKNIQCSSASQANIREITTQINQTKNNYVQPVTTVYHKTLALLLQNYDSAKANYLVCGFNNGFRIGLQGDRHFRASPNLKFASEFPESVDWPTSFLGTTPMGEICILTKGNS
jgi:hypothetical protein